jgi:hypothetical protein
VYFNYFYEIMNWIKVTLLSLCTLLVTSAAQGQTMVEMKPGLWEMRMLKMAMDGKDWLEPMRTQEREAQAHQTQLPPDQRQHRDPLAERLCLHAAIPKDWLSLQNIPGMPLDTTGCTHPKASRSGERITSEIICNKPDDKIKVKVDMVKTNETGLRMVTTNTTSKHTMVQEIQMRFLGSDCGGLKPADEEFKSLQGAQGGAKQ